MFATEIAKVQLSEYKQQQQPQRQPFTASISKQQV